jgi:hypothetical protein
MSSAPEQLTSARRQVKVLFVGPPGSGKSTFLKQLKLLYGQAWNADELLSLKPAVFANIVQNMRLLLKYAQRNGFDMGDLADAANTFISLPDDADLTGENGKLVKELWANPGVKEAWSKRFGCLALESLEAWLKHSGCEALECLEYYCNEIDRILDPGYIPTEQDILQAHIKTSGIVEEQYVIDGVQFVMVGTLTRVRIVSVRRDK